MSDGQWDRIRNGQGFIAALDQSGGSTPGALATYGVDQDAYSTPDEMFDLVHAMRVRIATSPAFDSRIRGAILFEGTMRRDIDGVPAATFLWERKSVVPFVKIDKGLTGTANDVQLMAPIPGLGDLLTEARQNSVFGTKARSLIHEANKDGISTLVEQQFEVGEQVLRGGLVPIIEPEVSIASTTKSDAEALLREQLLTRLDTVSSPVILKLTLPETAGYYQPLIDHPKVVRVLALSGGYSLEESVQRLSENPGVIASFSRVLTDGLHADQSPEQFNTRLDRTIGVIAAASVTTQT